MIVSQSTILFSGGFIGPKQRKAFPKWYWGDRKVGENKKILNKSLAIKGHPSLKRLLPNYGIGGKSERFQSFVFFPVLLEYSIYLMLLLDPWSISHSNIISIISAILWHNIDSSHTTSLEFSNSHSHRDGSPLSRCPPLRWSTTLSWKLISCHSPPYFFHKLGQYDLWNILNILFLLF